MVGGNGGNVVHIRFTNRTGGQNQDHNAQWTMDRDERVVVSQRGDHRHSDEQHCQKHRGHQPVEDARLEGELRAGLWRIHFSVSAVETALGSLRSPSRRVNDCE